MSDWEDMQGEATDYSHHEESQGDSNQMLHDRANRGEYAQNIRDNDRLNKNVDLRAASIRSVLGGIQGRSKSMSEGP